jgi:hypothetical protein
MRRNTDIPSLQYSVVAFIAARTLYINVPAQKYIVIYAGACFTGLSFLLAILLESPGAAASYRHISALR